MQSYFAQSSDADAIAATLPASLLPNYLASVDPAKTAALLQASIDVDRAHRWQGRKYDSINQANEFPRVAFEPSNAILPYPGAAAPPGLPGGPGFGATIWDWDATTLTVVVPQHVLTAVIYQADFILGPSLGNQRRLDAQYSGVRSQGAGDIREEYAPRSKGVETGLCRRAEQMVRKYRLVTGRMI